MLFERRDDLLRRAYLVFAFLLVISLVILGKVVRIQVVEGDKWRGMADSLYVRMVEMDSEMGTLLSEDGTILATSTVFYEVRMDLRSDAMAPDDFESNVDSLGWYLSTVIDPSRSPGAWTRALRKARKDGERYFLISRKLTYPQVQELRTFPLYRLGPYKGGLIVVEHRERSRPFGDLARRTIGSHKPGQFSYGLEGRYQDVLEGEKGYRLVQRLPKGQQLPVHDIAEISPKPGNDLVTTLDMGMQDMAHQSLAKALAHHQAESGVVMVMEVATGKIRAMVNLDRNGTGFSEQYNHAIGSAVEPGSIFKLASMMALLEDGHVRPEDPVDLQKGKATFYDRVMVDAHPHGLDTVTVQQAFEMSSNVGIAKLVQEHYGKRPEDFVRRLADFGLTGPVGIDLDGEAFPLIKHPQRDKALWSGITLPWMSMGYELKVTPLQLLTLYAGIANNGRMMRPMLVSEVQKYGMPVRRIHPQVLSRKVASGSTIKAMQAMLEGVVEQGTAKSRKARAYRFAGKTGTAHIRDKKTSEVTYRSSFVGYFPVEKPVYAVIVMINEARSHGYYGSEVALPVFREVADYCFQSRMELFPTFERIRRVTAAEARAPQWEAGFRDDFARVCRESGLACENKSETDWTVTQIGESEKLQLNNRFCPADQVPNVVGMGLRDALYALEQAGLKVDPTGVGKVRRQSVSAGTQAQGQYVRIYLE